MKTTLVVSAIAIGILLTSCNQQTKAQTKEKNEQIAMTTEAGEKKLPTIDFNKKHHDFGTIKEGELVSHTFTFTNTGAAPLVILNAKGSCGCTVPKWTKEAIEPGKSGEIRVEFNSKGKPNVQRKKVILTTNTKEGKEILTIEAIVTPKSAS